MREYISSFVKRFIPEKDFKCQLLQTVKYACIYLLALIYWELLLRTQIGFEDFSLFFLLFLPAEAMLLATLSGWFKNKYNRIITPVVMLIPFAYYVGQLVYYRIFGSLFSISMLGMGGDAVGDFGWALKDTLKNSVSWIALCFVPVVLSVVYSIFAPKKLFDKFSPKMHLFSLFQVVYLWFFAVLMLFPFGKGDFSPLYAYTSAYIDTDTASNRLGVLTNSLVELRHKYLGTGNDTEDNLLNVPSLEPPIDTEVSTKPSVDTSPNIIESINFEALMNSTDDKGKKALCEYFAALQGTNKNEYTGILKDYNLIYICAEGFSSYAIDPVVTPTLYKMSNGGIVLKNYYNSFKNTTTNGEFSLLTGLWPDVSRDADANSASGSFVQSKNNLMSYSLANMFNGVSAKTYAFHNFRGYYYQRDKTHKNLGYQNLKFMGGQGGMKFTTSWPSSDFEMMQQSIDDYINDEQFHAYYMTFSGHGPYSDANPIAVRNLETVEELLGDRKINEMAKYYLAANYELEKAMTLLLEKLEAAGKLDNTMIVLAGDHYPYYLSDSSYSSLAGHKVDTNFEKYKSTCIMYCSGIETVEVDAHCSNVDILPTVLNLFGFEYDSRLLGGVDVFSNNIKIAMLYNKSFITDKVKYNAQNGKTEWLEGSEGLTEDEKKSYLEYCISVTKMRYTSSLNIIEEDFYSFVTENTSNNIE